MARGASRKVRVAAQSGARARTAPESASESRRSARSRAKIVESARAVFFEQGFERANLNEVARRAGFAKGTIYRHFESKADLYLEVLARSADAFVARLRRALDPDTSAAEQIRRLGRFYFRHYTKPSQQEYFRIFWAIENQRLIGELPADRVEWVTGIWRQALAMLQEVVARGVASGEFREGDTGEMAHIVWVAANAVIAAAVVPEQRRLFAGNPGEAFERMVDVLLRGMAAR